MSVVISRVVAAVTLLRLDYWHWYWDYDCLCYYNELLLVRLLLLLLVVTHMMRFGKECCCSKQLYVREGCHMVLEGST
jgi:hypothetical protein